MADAAITTRLEAGIARSISRRAPLSAVLLPQRGAAVAWRWVSEQAMVVVCVPAGSAWR